MQDTQNSQRKRPINWDDSSISGVADLQLVEQEEGKIEILNKVYSAVLDQERDYPLPVPLISLKQNEAPVTLLTLMSFSLWQGKQKSKKTTALALMVAAFIRGHDEFFEIGLLGKALYFDTEQGQSYGARTMRTILKIAGVTRSPRLVYFDLREFNPLERLEIIAAAIEDIADVKLVIIDGLVDLLMDFMDAGQGHAAITEILKLCSKYNIHIAGVLHQNKADKNARAHIGTISSQKCEVEISTEVDPDDKHQSIVECVNSRGIPFEKFAIRWDKGSLPRVNTQWSMCLGAEARDNRNYERNRKVAEDIFKPFSALAHKEAIDAISCATKKGETTAKTYLKNYQTWGWVKKSEDGKYRINMEKGQGSAGSNTGSTDLGQ